MMKNKLLPHGQYPDVLQESGGNMLFIPFPQGVREDISEAIYLLAFRETTDIKQDIEQYNGKFYVKVELERENEIEYIRKRLQEAIKIVFDRGYTNHDAIGIIISLHCSGHLPKKLKKKKYK